MSKQTGSNVNRVPAAGTRRRFWGRPKKAGTSVDAGNSYKATKGRFWRTRGRKRRKGGVPEAEVTRLEDRGHGTKMLEWRLRSGEKWAVAKAKMQEKMTHFFIAVRRQFYTCTHPLHPLRRRAARNAAINEKIVATERRREKVAAARSESAGKRAGLSEARAARFDEAARLLS